MEKSAIQGFGYGSEHNWKDLGSRQLSYPAPKEQKCTTYKCRDCGEMFLHYYGIQPEIFEAMEDAKVKEACNKHSKLQQDFMNIVDQMIEAKCILPNRFKLFYAISEYDCKSGRILEIMPYLTEEEALEECQERQEMIKNAVKEQTGIPRSCIMAQPDSLSKYISEYDLKI